jgi:hypothetical protein
MTSPNNHTFSCMARLPGILCLASVLTLVGCATGDQQLITAEIVGYGIERREGERIVPDPNTATGQVRLIKNHQFTERTTEIPAVLGTAFSMCVEVKGIPRSEWGQLRHEVAHPAMTSPDGKTWRTHGGFARPVQGTGESALTCVGYGLDQPFEIVKGQWTLSVRYAGKTLASKQFTLR